MNPWRNRPVPAMRSEALYGDRVVRCFVDRPSSVIAMFERACAAYPAADAVVCDGRRWSHAQASAEAERLALGFATRGVAAGDRVLMFLGNRPEFVFVLLALQRLGAIAVPVGIREQRPGLAYIAGQCEAKAIVFDDELAERIPTSADAPSLALCLAADSLSAWPDPGGAAPAVAATHECDVAVILYTSGTTGHPKGAMLTHLNIVHSALHFEACMGLGRDDRAALAVPASHVTGLVAIVAAMWRVGGAVIVVPEFKAEAFVALVARERVTYTLMVPAMYRLCLLSEAFARADLSAWRVGGYGGAPMPVATIDELAARLPGLVLQNAYGATETTSPATMMPPGLTRDHADSVGVELPAAEIRVMDDDGRELPRGETGELWIGGPMVVPGYWANAEATAREFSAGFWHCGDLGSIDADGFLRVVDRKKDMLNRGGYKVYSAKVENVLLAWPGVVEAAVIGFTCPVLGERVQAVLYAPAGSVDEAALRAHCAAQLADYEVPERFVWSDQPLPRNANGKVMKRMLRSDASASAPAPTPAPPAAPATPTPPH